MINNVGYVIQVGNDMKRILRTLSVKKVDIEIDQDNDSTVIIASYERRRSVYIVKNKNSCTYQIDLLDETHDGEITIWFSSQSSVINFLKNNFLR
ncbi:hypothetical protein [Clostridium sp. ETTB3]